MQIVFWSNSDTFQFLEFTKFKQILMHMFLKYVQGVEETGKSVSKWQEKMEVWKYWKLL